MVIPLKQESFHCSYSALSRIYIAVHYWDGIGCGTLPLKESKNTAKAAFYFLEVSYQNPNLLLQFPISRGIVVVTW